MTPHWGEAEVASARTRIEELVARFPGVTLQDSGGHTGVFCANKRFAWLLVDHHGDGKLALWVKAPPGEQQALVSGDPQRYFVPAYLGSKGWVGVDLAGSRDAEWDEIDGLLEQGWRMSAGKRAVTTYDQQHSS